MRKMTLKWRVIIPVGLTMIVGIAAIITLIGLQFSSSMKMEVQERLLEMSYRYANQVKANLEMSLGATKALSSVFGKASGSERASREYYQTLMAQLVIENKSLFGAWACYEPNAFDGKDEAYKNKDAMHDATGRFIPYLYLNNSGGVDGEPLTDYEVPGAGDYYLVSKRENRESLTEPFFYQAGGNSYYITSVTVPIVKDNKVLGVTGGDINLTPICDFLNSVKLYESGSVSLFDSRGHYVFHPDKSFWSKPSESTMTPEAYAAIKEVIRTNKPQFVESKSIMRNEPVLYALAPIKISDNGEVWVMRCTVPTDEAMANVQNGVMLTIGLGLLILILSIIMLYFQVAGITKVLTNIGSRIFTSSDEVTSASGTISEASISLAEGATEQASSLEETSSALEQMASMTRQNADNTTKTNTTNQQNNKLIAEGADAVRNMSTAMGEINDSAEKISRIIKTIEDIAFQTNLLALNAAVEAARAGEAGKGFAVVADEVRNLAQRSAQAARDTTELIEGTVMRVRHGSEIATALDKSFKHIEEGSNEVSRLIAEITSATNEQAQGVDQVNTAVAQMDKVTQQNAANAEETASVSKQLNEQALTLNSLVRELSTLLTGKENEHHDYQPQPSFRKAPIRGQLMIGMNNDQR